MINNDDDDAILILMMMMMLIRVAESISPFFLWLYLPYAHCGIACNRQLTLLRLILFPGFLFTSFFRWTQKRTWEIESESGKKIQNWINTWNGLIIISKMMMMITEFMMMMMMMMILCVLKGCLCFSSKGLQASLSHSFILIIIIITTIILRFSLFLTSSCEINTQTF